MLKKLKIVNLIITLTLNNIFIVVTTYKGKTLCNLSSGRLGFKGTKKKTNLAIQMLIKIILNKFYNISLILFNIFIKGQDAGIPMILNTLKNKKKVIKIHKLKILIPISHNGCRAPQKRSI